MRHIRLTFLNYYNHKRYLIKLILCFVIFNSQTKNCLSLTDVHQPEFSGFESFGTTDMVNLATGDFTYNVPIIEIPSPEGGYALPLTYHGGVGLDQESSWTGLGWNINPGSVQRNAYQYPDDSNGDLLYTSIQGYGGEGYSIDYVFYTKTYDSNTGFGGEFSLFGLVKIGSGTMKGFSLIGVSVNNGKIGFSPIEFASAVMTAVGYIVNPPASIAMEAATSVGASVASSLVSYAIMNGSSMKILASANDWEMQKEGCWGLFTKNKYKYILDVTKHEPMFGSIYLQGLASNLFQSSVPYQTHFEIRDNGSASANTEKEYKWILGGYDSPVGDMYMKVNSYDHIGWLYESTHVAYDQYAVSGEGVSGDIQPYRLEIGDLPLQLHDGHYKACPFSPYQSYKVPFRYFGNNANSYQYHLGQGDEWGVTTLSQNNGGVPSNIIWNRTDDFFYDSGKRKKHNGGNSSDIGYLNNQIAQDKYIQWYSNSDIAAFDANPTGHPLPDFIECTQGGQGFSRSGLPSNGIGAFCITRPDGMTYHYSLPVYNHQQFVKSFDSNNYANYAFTYNANNYVIDWLLTAITGPDFIDRGTIGKIDDQDWGYWVKFDYGKFSSNYHWRGPFSNYASGTIPTSYKNYSTGLKETYYLNSISTRTHTALFVKDLKTDGKGYSCNCTNDDLGNFVETLPSGALKLTQILLLTNTDYQKLINNYGFSINSGNNQSDLKNGDTYSNVIDEHDLSSSMNGFIQSNVFRKVVLNYANHTDELCKNTLNSFDYSNTSQKYGKLTLNSVSFFGKNNIKLIPDFRFYYENSNPDYDPNKWDGWGMYTPNGFDGWNGHQAKSNGVEWSLTRIVNPLGGEIRVVNERDRYSSISGNAISNSFSSGATYDATTNDLTFASSVSLPPNLSGSTITITADYTDWSTSGCNDPCCEYPQTGINYLVHVISVTGNVIEISPNLQQMILDGHTLKNIHSCSGRSYDITNVTLNVSPEKYGDNLRVSEIQISDESGNTYKTNYIYSVDGTDNGLTSGCCSKEPEFIRNYSHFWFYDNYDFPQTPIIYKKVTVISGISQADPSKHLDKTEYNFTVPDQNMITEHDIHNRDGDQGTSTPIPGPHSDYDDVLKEKGYHFDIKTSKIGSIESILKYDNKNELTQKTTYGYNNDMDMGKYTEGSIYNAIFRDDDQSKFYYTLIRTNKVYYPNVLQTISVSEKGDVKTITNTDFDFMTGSVLATTYTNSMHQMYKTEVTPAYQKYSQMSSKVYDPNNKNMLSQTAIEKTWVSHEPWLGGNGQPSWDLLSADVQTWAGSWNTTRIYSGTQYVDNGSVGQSSSAWRKKSGYVWKSLVNPDGTIPTTGPETYVDFNFTSGATQNWHWQKGNENYRYDNYSHPLETIDINGRHMSTKYGYFDNYVLASVPNTKYTEFAYSGAEDLVMSANGSDYFGGEVSTNANTQSLTHAHTGLYSIKLNNGQYGFGFSGSVGNGNTFDFEFGKKYNASVWLYDNSNFFGQNMDRAVLYYALTGSGGSNDFIEWQQCRIIESQTKKFGHWYLLSLQIDLNPANIGPASLGSRQYSNITKLYVNCWNPLTNGDPQTSFYFDDFRIHPVDAPMKSYVYDTKSGNVTAELDEQNVATKYTYDAAGRLISVWRETPDRFKKVSQNFYHYGRP
jgi:YD repeat-containing protein